MGHAATFKFGVNYCGPTSGDKKLEWAKISGLDYYVEIISQNKKELRLVPSKGFLTWYSTKHPDEDLAEWVGITYDLYVKNETFSDLLKPGTDLYDIKNKKKIDFLLKKEFINQKIYDAVTKVKKNTKYYLEFNE